jgi:DNA-binding Lrp family transcriptional regulator
MTPSKSTTTQTSQPKLDRIDLQILAILQQDARLTNVMLAERVGLSASPCLERVRRLEKAKLVSAYRAVLNLERLIPHVYAFMEVTLVSHHPQDFLRFERYIQNQPEVLACSLISGDFDYLIRVVATDIAHLHAVSERMFRAEIGIDKHFTYICVKMVKDTTEIPIEVMLAARQQTAL